MGNIRLKLRYVSLNNLSVADHIKQCQNENEQVYFSIKLPTLWTIFQVRLDWIQQLFLAHVIHTSSNNCEIERTKKLIIRERNPWKSTGKGFFPAFLFSVSRSMKRKLTTFHWAIIRDWIGFSLRTTNLLNFIIYTKIYLNRNKFKLITQATNVYITKKFI